MVGNGFRVHTFFPVNSMPINRMSPFFMLDYNAKIEFSPSNIPRGVGVHPHRGFETVTIAYKGKVAHHDSTGNSGIIGEGDVQWMTAASGILHKEYHELEFSKKGGMFQMVQLWVNLPAKFKMSPPKYQPITHEEMGIYKLPDDAGQIEIIAGEFSGVKGPANTFSRIEMYNIKLKKGREVSLNLPAGFNTGLLMLEGNLKINGETGLPIDNFALFKNEGEQISLLANEDSVALLLSGEPINEPIVSYGPFLMNTQEEIIQAINDVNNGKFGHLED